MRKLKYHVASTPDGFIARKDHTVDGFVAEGEHVTDYSTVTDFARFLG